ncbi:MAG: hypothetical protein ACI4XB_09750, partial [Ruminococcus sp.]
MQRKAVSKFMAMVTTAVMSMVMIPVTAITGCKLSDPPVYLYALVQDEEEALTNEQISQLSKAGLVLNKDGYFTIGMISSVSGLPAPGGRDYPISGDTNRWSSFKSIFLDDEGEFKLASDVVHYVGNQAITIENFDWDASGIKLAVCSGAADYVADPKIASWHLDGVVDIDELTAEYKIEHYTEDLDGNGYTLAQTTTKTAQLGATGTAESIAMEGFTYDAENVNNILSGTVDASDTLVLKCYYQRNRDYTVTWVNDDGTVLETDTGISYGETPGYDYTASGYPQKESTAQYSYIFQGWTDGTDTSELYADPTEFPPVTKNVTYTASYLESTQEYTVTWMNWDGTVLETDMTEYGKTPTYDGEEPTRAADKDYIYTFTAWDPKISEVTGTVTYTAQFEKQDRTFLGEAHVLLNDTLSSIEEMLGDGTKLYVQNVSGGDYIVMASGDTTGVYTASLTNGTYNFYTSTDGETFTALGEQQLVIDGDSGMQYLCFYSVTYDGNGNTDASGTMYYPSASAVTLPEDQPAKDGYCFKGWQDAEGNTYQPGDLLTDCIDKAYTLTAQWEEIVTTAVSTSTTTISETETTAASATASAIDSKATTTCSTTASTTKSTATSATASTAGPTNTTTCSTTASTTKLSTTSTTKPTTNSTNTTTCSTTASTTKPTTSSTNVTTCSTTASTTKPSTASTTKPTTSSTNATTCSTT